MNNVTNNHIYEYYGKGWLVYASITEPAPSSTVKARVQFTKSSGGSELLIDKVVQGRLV